MDNYLNLCSGAKWPLELMPLKVYIGYYHLYNNVNPSNAGICQNIIKKAFLEWQNAMNNKICFDILPNGGDNLFSSQINVRFHDSESIHGGTTSDINENNLIYGSGIDIYMPRNYFDMRQLYFVTLCEIGICLGLGNSNIPEDLTYRPYRFMTETPSQRDINTINLLYGFATNTFFPDEDNYTISSERNMWNELDGIAEAKKNLFNINFRNKN